MAVVLCGTAINLARDSTAAASAYVVHNIEDILQANSAARLIKAGTCTAQLQQAPSQVTALASGDGSLGQETARAIGDASLNS